MGSYNDGFDRGLGGRQMPIVDQNWLFTGRWAYPIPGHYLGPVIGPLPCHSELRSNESRIGKLGVNFDRRIQIHNPADRGYYGATKRAGGLGRLLSVATQVRIGGVRADEDSAAARGGNFHGEDEHACEKQISEQRVAEEPEGTRILRMAHG